MRLLALPLVLLVVLALPAAAALAVGDGWVHTAIEGGGACARVLADGVFGTWFATLPAATSRSEAQSAFQSTMCSFATEVAELGTSRGGMRMYGIYIGDYAFAFARSEDEAARRIGTYRSTLCSAGSDIGQTAMSTFASWIDPNILTAYDSCLEMAAAGLSMDAITSRDGNIITITLGYARSDGGSVTFWRSAVNGPAFCKFLTDTRKPFKLGYVLTARTGKHSIQCQRQAGSKDQGPVSITVTTSAGSRRFDMPDLVPPTVEQRLNERMDSLQQGVSMAVARLRSDMAGVKSQLAAAASVWNGSSSRPRPKGR
ncbi:hypothetical protein ABPG75_012099 [Micractinium tetrahymenae]